MTWRQVVLGIVAMIQTRAKSARTNIGIGPPEIEKARADAMQLAYQWIMDDLKYLAERPPHEALPQVREWIRRAREAGIELPKGTP